MKINCPNCKRLIKLGTEVCPCCAANTMVERINLPRVIQHQDSFLWITIVLPSIVLVACNIHFSFHPGMYFGMLTLFQIAVLIPWLFIIGIRILFALWRKLPQRALSCVFSLVFLWPTSMFLDWVPIGDYVHLAVAYPEYKARIDASPNTRLEFDWGVFGILGGATRTLVYDPGDKLPQENRIKGAELREKTCKDSGDACWALTTKQLFGHFYLVTEWH